MSLPASVPVKVNFNIVIDADSKVKLFGEQVPAPTNVIVAEHTLPVTALYDPENLKGLLEIWEPSDAQGDIKCQLANSDTSATGGPVLTGAYQTAAKRLAAGFEAILCDSFDCSGASPYSNYAANVEYYKQRDFGRVALGMMAHYLFGHVDATAAITNDKAFVESMLSISAHGDNETAEGAAARAAAFTKSTAANVEAWSYAASSADANLALRLVEALIKKGKAGADIASATLVQSSVAAITDTATDATLANIVKQVIGQDSSRTQNVDGSQRTRDQHLLLRFYAGDVIYMNIKVKKPTVEVTGYSGGANAPANSLVTEQSYVLKITLSNPSEADPSKLTYSNGGLTVTGYTGALNGTLVIPAGVTEIANNAFQNKTGLTAVVIPSGVTRIGDNAFDGCTALKSASIPSTVTAIRYFAFQSCSALTAISIPGAAAISPYAFASCVAATSISIPNIVSIGTEAFNNCRFASVAIPASLTGWDNSAFATNPALLSVTIAQGITAIPNYSFYACANLSSVSLPASLTSIGGNVFRACTGLTSISIPSGVTSMGGSAFMETRLTSVVLPNCATIPDECFKDVPTLTSVTFNSNNITVGAQAFRYTNLVNVSMPNVTTIDGLAFANNNSLLTVSAPNATTVAANAFDNCPNLTSHP